MVTRTRGSGIDRVDWDLIIVGAGAAGMSAAETARLLKPGWSVLLLSEEDRLPYKRTKISKHIAGGFAREAFAQQPAEWYSGQGLELAVGVRAVGLDPDGRRLELTDGTRLSWSRLILAAGADPVLPALPVSLGEDDGHFVVRTAAQVEALRRALGGARRVAVIGAGVLGVEVAEQLRLHGLQVVLIGRGERLMPRELNNEGSDRLREALTGNGVSVRLEEREIAVQRRRRRGYAVALAHGEARADLVVFCLGARPRIDLAAEAGLRTDRGILVDAAMRTSHPEIFAAGDAAQHPDGAITHLWHAAQHQGELAARSAAGQTIRHESPPFRLKCEVFGQYFFSMNVPLAREKPGVTGAKPGTTGTGRRAEGAFDAEPLDPVEEADGAVYRCLYYRGDNLLGALMVNDRERAKAYERAVREGWTRGRVAEELPLKG
ncbi:MAG: FAD-dependent oxidoreductase [Spirochaetales bacterium]|nr:FAD-dependent oxidoreductase [Spirochaetales bacterium]